ncbi:hypothetical protein B0H17DRAFT_1148964 [Mycena rosella]|uniref:Uncharacterized protein n=1 Tax=Mycena rosella TaxID=1033263 RepID=A0AAD7C6M9_MYCRO|nr:hypothetical protein B0H17DRAFT_1148964 [Mycena rosella]
MYVVSPCSAIASVDYTDNTAVPISAQGTTRSKSADVERDIRLLYILESVLQRDEEDPRSDADRAEHPHPEKRGVIVRESTGVVFLLESMPFPPSMWAGRLWARRCSWHAYGNEVLAQYNVPSEEEIAALSDSDADDEEEEEEEIDLADTDSEMEVDNELNG